MIFKPTPRTFLLAVLALALLIRWAGAAVSPVGTYTCQGTQHEGEPYTMRLLVEELGSTFEFSWQVEVDVPPKRWITLMGGLAIPAGDHLAVAIVGPKPPSGERGVGVAHYTVKPGVLEGVWARGDGEIYSEKCSSGRAA